MARRGTVGIIVFLIKI